MSLRESSEDVLAVEFADTPDGLAAIKKPGCAAAIWRRSPQPAFQTWLDTLKSGQLPRARVLLRPEQMREATAQICQIASTPQCEELDRLIDDAAALAELFADLMRAPYLRLRFDVITTNACRKFHTDTVTARLICTYRGTGTQYGISTNGEAPHHVMTVPTGAPILLRGKLWPERPESGLLHRSPPIEGTDETRLVLVLDPVLNPADHPGQKLYRTMHAERAG